jgi:hypothetical protein
MKKSVRYIFIIIFIFICFAASALSAEKGIIGTIGLPAGYMDLSYNAGFYTRVNVLPSIEFEGLLQNSYASAPVGRGTVANDVVSLYLLGRYNLDVTSYPLKPYVAAGWGGHVIGSFSSDDSPANGESDFNVESKGHIFVGADYNLFSRLFLTGYARVTYPSDVTLDSGYLGLGFRF